MTTIILHSHIGKKGDLFPQQGAAQAEFKIPAAVQVRSQSNKNICVISTVRGKRCRRRSFKFRSTISGNYINNTTHCPPVFRVESTRNYLEVLHCFWLYFYSCAGTTKSFINLDTIDQISHLCRPAPAKVAVDNASLHIYNCAHIFNG